MSEKTGASSKYKLIWSIVLVGVTALLTLVAWYFLQWRWLYLWIAIATVVTAVALIYDKWRAKRNAGETGKGRIPEIALLASCVIGGTVGAYAAIFTLQHKTGDRRFLIRLVILTVIQAVGFGYYLAQS
jgi:uncharacterized membrane protein YsdA (DUF1294 family)